MNLKEAYTTIRQYTEQLCEPLAVEDYVVQVATFASPPKWHLAHTTWFFETFVLLPNVSNYKVFDANFNYLFNSYYNTVGDRVLQSNRGNLSRPNTDKIYAYRQYVDSAMEDLLNNIGDVQLEALITLGLHHEQQHQELLLTDIKFMFGHHPIFPEYNTDYSLIKDTNQSTESIKIKAGVYEIGYNGESFCYDNELGVHKVYVDDFTINNYLVTNGEYLEFMTSGAYSNFNLWLDEGWQWINENNIKAPLYWHKIENEWQYYSLSGLQKIDKAACLCHINFYEAQAYAQWKGMRLPTEFEWEIAAQQLDWGKRWEWTNSAYLPYPNFKIAEGAVGEYNGKFMSNKMVLRGASTATSPNHSRTTYRNFFNPVERWQFTGIRLVH